VRLSRSNVIRGYDLAVAVTFLLIAGFAISGVIPRPAIIALAALPLAFPVRRALRDSYESPYALMPAMGKNIQLHLVTGLLLVAGYVIAIVADAALDDPPFFLH
jgi:1,4-dihydroxy-2-naphthoate octaprenyltransferase